MGEGELATLVADTGSTDTSYTDATTTEAGETYAYQVKAIRGEDWSQASGQTQVQVPHDPVDLAPSNLAAASLDDGINLAWNAPAADAESVTGYQVLRRRPNQGEDQLVVLESNTASTETTYKDTGATAPGQTYVYGVRGCVPLVWSRFITDALRIQDSGSASHWRTLHLGLSHPRC